MTTAPPIVLAGAGIGGLTLGIALQRRGLRPLVLERAPEPREAGAGITVQTNAMVVMDALGLADRIQAEGRVLTRGDIRTSRGVILSQMDLATDLADVGRPGVAIHRRRLLAVLAQAFDGELRCGATVVGFEARPDAVRVRLEGGEEVEAAALVGCDGLHSAVRRALLGEEPLRYAGYTTWRGIAEDVETNDGRTTEIWGAGDRFGLVPIGPRTVYWFAVAEAPAGGTDSDDVLLRLRRRFAGWPPEVDAALRGTTEVLRTDVYDRPPIERWGEGLATLLGDAAHPMTPNLGQGAGQAIEDAWALAAALATQPDLAAGLRAYESVRRERANDFVRRSYRLGAMAQWRNPIARRLRDLTLWMTPRWVMRRSIRALYTPVPRP